MTARRHDSADLRRFLRAVDDALGAPVSILVIGGSSLLLAYGVASATHDIDTYDSPTDLLADAAERARTATGLPIPITAPSLSYQLDTSSVFSGSCRS
jgi:uncharacterized nucleotidyltransferase DUF6036